MTTIDPIRISDLLAQMQRLSESAEGAAPNAPEGDFAALLKTSIEKVNEAQSSASEMAAAFERGDAGTSLPEVMIALQKASLSFQAMTEVRNQLVNAYQEIMNLPV
jgi:flagellar hook-basal body complex protein FliE